MSVGATRDQGCDNVINAFLQVFDTFVCCNCKLFLPSLQIRSNLLAGLLCFFGSGQSRLDSGSLGSSRSA